MIGTDVASALLIIPAFNESEALPAVLAELAEVAPGHDVVVIDDGSVDDTSQVARSAGVAVVTLPFNLGIGGALRTGFRYAVEQGYQRAFQFDADGQHDPAEIWRLSDALDAGADLAIGSRFATDDSYDPGVTRGAAMRLLRGLMKLLTGRSFTDTSSGFRGFSRPMLEAFATTYPSEYMESVEALAMAERAGFEVVEVGTPMRGREAGVPSNRSLKLAFHYLRLVLVVGVGSDLPARSELGAVSP